jgi:3-hydroxyacyl-[acyl-carrier-protein] dehydratase
MAKNVSMAEEYLADHFPQFPVLPGVMMLEAAIQTAAWLVRQQLDFAPSLVVLKEARGVRYGNFVSPGQTLVMTADAVEISPARSDFKVKGTIGPNGPTAIQARLELAHLSLSDTDAGAAKIDTLARNAMRERWQTITQRSGAATAAPALA